MPKISQERIKYLWTISSIIGIIIIVHAYLAHVSYMDEIGKELMVWTIIYIVCAYGLFYLQIAFLRELLPRARAPSAIWVVGTLIIVYRKLRKHYGTATEKTEIKASASFVTR